MSRAIVCILIGSLFTLSSVSALVQITSPPSSGYIFNVTEDTLFNYTLEAVDTESDPIVFTDTSHDANVSFFCFEKFRINDTASLINFTPTNEYVGQYSFEINARDPNDEVAAIVVYFNVSNTNDPPLIINTSPGNYTVSSEIGRVDLRIDIRDDDIMHNESLAFDWFLDGDLATATPKLNASSLNSTVSLASYAPSIEDFEANLHNISVTVTDQSGASVNHTWVINVTNVNRNPRFNRTIGNRTWPEDTDLAANISLMDHFYDEDSSYEPNQSCYHDPDLDTCLDFGYMLVNGTADEINISISQAGNVSLYPVDDWFGTWAVRFYVDDGWAVNYSNEVILNITNEPDPPLIDPIPNQEVYAYTNLTYQVNATDIDGEALSYHIYSAGLPEITMSPSGLIHLEALPSMVNDTWVDVTVGDGLYNSSIVFNLSVLDNSRPDFVMFPDNYTSVDQHEDSNVTVQCLDADSDVLDVWTDSALFYGSTRINDSAFAFRILPADQSLVGNHTVTMEVNDSKGARNSYTFTLEIIDVPKPPRIYDVSVPGDQLKVNVPVNITVKAFDEDGNIVDFSDNATLFEVVTNSTGDENTNASGLISFTPGTLGYYEINVSVVDSGGLSNSTILVMNVTENRAPYFTSVHNITCEQNRPCIDQFLADDPDWQDEPGFNYSIVNETNSTDFFIQEDGVVAFTPAFIGVYDVLVWVTDGELNETRQIRVNITKINNPPVVMPSPLSNMSVWRELTENQSINFNISAFDIENLSTHLTIDILRFTDLNGTIHTGSIPFESQFMPGFTTRERRNMLGDMRNITTWHFSLLPDWDEVGSYVINITVTDNTTFTSEEFSFDVMNFNNPPTVNWTLDYPYENLSISSASSEHVMNSTENTTLDIQVNAFEKDFEEMEYTWKMLNFNGSSRMVGNSSGISFLVPYDAYPNMTLMLSVEDEQNATTNVSWNMDVTNANRQVRFGQYVYRFNSSEGTYMNMVVEDGALQFAGEPGSYSGFGQFTSETLDFQTYSHDIPRIDYETIVLNDEGQSQGYDIMLETAGSREYAETLTLWNVVEDDEIASEEYRYFGFRVGANSSDPSVTPNITRALVSYSIHGLEVPSNHEYSYWINLNHFFKDPDKDDALTYDYEIMSGQGLVNVTLEQGYIVSLQFLDEGQAFMAFNATDPFGSSVLSNVINITIEDSESAETRPTTSTGGGVTIRTEYKYKRVMSPISLDIIHPDSVTVYENETVSIPVRLVNNEEFNFKELTIDAYADREGLDISLSKDEIAVLPMQESETFVMTLNMSGVYDSYGIYVTVNVSEPEYQDTAKIMISSLKRMGHSEDSQQMKFAFVRDLLSKNKECTELSEYIDRARNALEDGEYGLADDLLESFINDCKLLMQERESQTERPVQVKPENVVDKVFASTENLAIALIIGIASLIVLVLVMVLAYKRI